MQNEPELALNLALRRRENGCAATEIAVLTTRRLGIVVQRFLEGSRLWNLFGAVSARFETISHESGAAKSGCNALML